MLKTPRRRRLVDAYAFPGFRAGAGMRGRFGDPQMRIVTLARRAKKRAAALVGRCIAVSTIAHAARGAICRAERFGFPSIWKCAGFFAFFVLRRTPSCSSFWPTMLFL